MATVLHAGKCQAHDALTYVEVSKEELENVALESRRTSDIQELCRAKILILGNHPLVLHRAWQQGRAQCFAVKAAKPQRKSAVRNISAKNQDLRFRSTAQKWFDENDREGVAFMCEVEAEEVGRCPALRQVIRRKSICVSLATSRQFRIIWFAMVKTLLTTSVTLSYWGRWRRRLRTR